MPWCNACRREFAGEIETCPHCDAPLADEVPDADKLLTDVEWIVVAEHTGEVLGRLIQAKLESEGIPVTVTGSSFDSVRVYGAFDARICVPKRFEEDAKAMVDDMIQASKVEE